MTEIPILSELALIAFMAVIVSLLVRRIKLPTVAGLLLAGALLGPFGFQLVSDLHSIEIIAEVGVVLLLFTIGLEFSLARLKHIFQRVALGGLLQVGLTIAAVAGLALLGGWSGGTAIFLGFVFALSSTAIVLRALAERRELDAPHGRFIVGALIFQDLCVVPMVLLVPMLGAGAEGGLAAIGIALAKAAAVVVGVLFLARLVVPRLLGWVDASRSREVFLLAVLALCIGTAWLTSLAGLSLALGAFLGGIVVADTEYSHRAMGDLLPLRDVFVSVFFVSLGMFFDGRVVLENPLLVAALLAGFMLGKGALATFAAVMMRFPPRAAWLAGVGLAQFGEFGFVLVRLGLAAGVITAAEAGPLLSAGILSMFLTPLLIQRAPHITAGERLLGPLARLMRARTLEADDAPVHALKDHVVVVGYGLAGRLLAASLRHVQSQHIILELNAENVRGGREAGDPVYYADATSEEALRHVHLERARAIVVMINDPPAALRVVDTARRVAPDVAVFIRARYLAESDALQKIGATDVVAEEVEGAVELMARVLRSLEVPRNVIDAQVDAARTRTQHSARAHVVPRAQLGRQAHLAALKIESVLLVSDSPLTRKSLKDMDLRHTTGATLVAVRRGEELLSHPPASEPLQAGDVVYLIGEVDAVSRAMALLDPGGA